MPSPVWPERPSERPRLERRAKSVGYFASACAVGRLGLGVAAQAVEGDAAGGQEGDVVAVAGAGRIEAREGARGVAGGDLGAGELEQDVAVVGPALARGEERLLGAGILAEAGVAAPEADEGVDGVRVLVELLLVEGRGRGIVARRRRARREPAGRPRPGLAEPAAARAGAEEGERRHAGEEPCH